MATTEFYPLSLHDALPIYVESNRAGLRVRHQSARAEHFSKRTDEPHHVGRGDDGIEIRPAALNLSEDRKSTRLNSSHSQNSYAVFCLKKKKTAQKHGADRC